MKKSVILGATVFFLSTAAYAQEVTVPNGSCQAAQSSINTVENEFKPQMDKIARDGQDLGDDAGNKSDLELQFEVEMKEQKWIFDLPSVTMKTQRIVISVPQVTMRTQSFSWDVPEIRMVPKKVGQYPEVVVDGFNVTVRWRDIITDVPETTMVRHEWSMDIPETRLTDTEMSFNAPEFKMERQEWILNVPEFKLKQVNVAGVPVYNDFQKRSQDIKDQADSVKGAMKAELVSRTSALFVCQRAMLQAERSKAVRGMSDGIAKIEAAINQATAAGVPAEKLIVNINGNQVKMTDQLEALRTKLVEATAKFDSALAQMDAQEKEAVAKMTAS